MSPPRLVGIDLGTTHTVVAWAESGSGVESWGIASSGPTSSGPAPSGAASSEIAPAVQGGSTGSLAAEPARVFAIAQLVSRGEIDARPTLPSTLYAALEGEQLADPWGDAPWILGELAAERGARQSGRLVTSAKSWLSHSRVDRTAPILPWTGNGSEEAARTPKLSPVQASARLLAHLRRAWDDAFPAHPLAEQQLVLTVPASFDPVARELTVRAAREAGLGVRLLEEPQAAFYAYLAAGGERELGAVLRERGGTGLVLVCDVGGGTTDLTLLRASIDARGALVIDRVAVGPHLLLGGDNMDLALAHHLERELVEPGAGLDPARFAALVAACRAGKERLLGSDPPDDVPIAVAGTGASLVGGTRTTRLSRRVVEQTVLDGFFPIEARDVLPARGRAGLVGFGLPYEREPAITRHLAAFLARHAGDQPAPLALLLNGGSFASARVRERLVAALSAWGEPAPVVLSAPEPELAVARGAVAYLQALAGRGLRIGGGTPRGYYVGVEHAGSGARRALCVVPKGAREGERHVAHALPLALVVGEPVRFDLYVSDTALHGPGQLVDLDDESFVRLPPVTTHFEPLPVHSVPAERGPAERVPAASVPAASVPAASVPAERAAADELPRDVRALDPHIATTQINQARSAAPRGAGAAPRGGSPVGASRVAPAPAGGPPVGSARAGATKAGVTSGALVRVRLEGELSAVGTVELACVEEDAPAGAAPRRFRLAFDVHQGRAPDDAAPSSAPPAAPMSRPAPARAPVSGAAPSGVAPSGVAPSGASRPPGAAASSPPAPRFEEARTLIERVFGKGRGDVPQSQVRHLLRELERVLGEREGWGTELSRALADELLPWASSRRRSADHERVFWMLAGYCLRPGFGHPLDARRVGKLASSYREGVTFADEARVWQQFWIAWRRLAGGLEERTQIALRDLVDPFLAPAAQRLEKRKGFRPGALDELLATAAFLERVPAERRAALGGWILDRTFTDRDPRLWTALGQLGARVPVYASGHHVVSPRVAEEWLAHLLRERWDQVPTAARAAFSLTRLTGDRARDVSSTVRDEVLRRLESLAIDAAWLRALREVVVVEEAERAASFGESLPVGLRLVSQASTSQ